MVVTYDKDLKYGVEAGQIVVTAGKLLTGIEYPAAKWVLISEGDIFKSLSYVTTKPFSLRSLLRRFALVTDGEATTIL